MSFWTNIKNNYGTYISRGVGATAAVMLIKDAHKMGKIRAYGYARTKDAQADEYFVSNTIATDNPTTMKINMQNGVCKWQMRHNFRNFINSGIGYFKGFFGSLVNNVIPFVLTMGALLGKKGLAKGSAVGLGIYSLAMFCKYGLGIGKNKEKIGN